MVEISFENSLIIGKVSNSTELESYFEAGIAISVFYDEEGSACPNERRSYSGHRSSHKIRPSYCLLP